MAVEIAHDTHRQVAIMYDNTTDTAFGPIFQGPGCAEDAADFIDWLRRSDEGDPREHNETGLGRLYTRWLRDDENRRGV